MHAARHRYLPGLSAPELRADQLQGSAGLLRVREELLARINAAVRPVRVKDVLFNEMLIQ